MAYLKLGSTKLTGAGTTVAVSDFAEKTNLMVMANLLDAGSSINPELTFNGDNSSGNYSDRRNFNFGTDGTTSSHNFIEDLWNSDPFPVYLILYINNIADQEKSVISTNCVQQNTAGAGTAPNIAYNFSKWANAVDSITTISFDSTNNFNTNSELTVFGTD